MASPFGQSPELLCILAEHLDSDTPTLFSLCLVSHAFHGIFSPALYRHLKFVLELPIDDQPQNVEVFNVDAKHIDHAVTLSVSNLTDIVDLDEEPTPNDYRVNYALAKLIERIPNLQSFSSYNGEVLESSLRTLAEFTSLRELTLLFDDDYQYHIGIGPVEGDDYPERWAVHGTHFGGLPFALAAFKSLTQLDLLGIWGDLQPWAEGLIGLLSQCRMLESLRLSMSEECFNRTHLAEDDDDMPQMIWPKVWSSSASDTPLRLRRFHVGYGIDVPCLDDMKGLVDLEALEDFAMWNELTFEGTTPEYDVDWQILAPNETPNLRLFTCYTLNDDVWNHLDTIVNNSRPLGLRFYKAEVGVPDYFDILPHYTGSAITGVLYPFQHIDGTSEGLQSLKNKEYLESLGLAFRYTCQELDRVNLYSTAMCDAFKKLHKLSSLWLYGGVFVTNDQTASEALGPVVKRLAQAGQALTYIRVGDIAWRVRRPDGEVDIQLLNQADAKRLCPEIFRVCKYDPLPGYPSISEFLRY